jgi:hypothetical protein
LQPVAHPDFADLNTLGHPILLTRTLQKLSAGCQHGNV